jgi:ribonuclease HI
MTLTIYTDGGSLNNPGQAAIAYVMYLDKELVTKHSHAIGIASNNIAEYTALLEAFTYATTILPKHSISAIHVFADSQLMINQLNGLYKVKNAPIQELLMKIRLLEGELNKPTTYTHVLREKNELADSLVKKALGR